MSRVWGPDSIRHDRLHAGADGPHALSGGKDVRILSILDRLDGGAPHADPGFDYARMFTWLVLMLATIGFWTLILVAIVKIVF